MFAFDPGCVKTHTSARCRKYNSKTHGFHSGLQYDLACLLASHRKLFYALSGRWSFHTTKTLSGHSILHCTYPPMMLWTAPTLRHQSAKGWLREANHVEGSRPWARLARLALISRSQSFRYTALMALAR